MSGTPLTATYRLQLTPSFGFAQAAAIVPYLRELGISHLYLSPVMEARAGSEHGYDVTDPTELRAELGGAEGWAGLVDAGLPIVLDIVPNHMAADAEDPWWADPARRERFFDLDHRTGRHRRFFLVDELAGVRQEDPTVFATTHRLVLALVAAGEVAGLRVDHVDGLADPAGYLRRLAAEAPVPLWVEKILHPGEAMRPWPIAGTTGYEFLAQLDAAVVDPAAEATFTELYGAVTGERKALAAVSLEARREMATGGAPEVARLRRLLDVPGIAEALASMPVYRTYLDAGATAPDPDDDTALVATTLTRELAAAFARLDPADRAFVVRFQQTSPGVMAKGVEDTAFYRYHRLLALNEVGNDPGRFSAGIDQFHAASQERLERFPLTLLAATTHDTKRSADVRARLLALTHGADEFASLVPGWMAAAATAPGAPDIHPNVQWFVLQTLLGAGSVEPERLRAYLEKAMREGGQHTSWANPDEAWEAQLDRFVKHLRGDPAFLRTFQPFADRIGHRGEAITRSMVLLRVTSPGVPDTYQGDERPYVGLVDPDNRRPVDWAAHRAALDRVRRSSLLARGEGKLLLLHQALLDRHDDPGPYEGAYTPLDAGPATVAFLRGREEVAVVAPLRPHPSAEVDLPPGTWHDRLAGATVEGGRRRVADLVAGRGVALLRRPAPKR